MRISPKPGSMAIHTRRSSGTSSTYYVTRDHLGSATAVMNENGASLVNLSFAAFGARRGSGWNDVPLSGDWTQITATSRRGFTGHEMLDAVSAIHMNGRVYDPKLGRFMSADPVWTGDLNDPQSLNPYSYVGNNPLSATDPSGYFLSKVRKKAKRAARRVGSGARRVVRKYGRQIVGAVAAYYTAGLASGAYATAATNAAVASGGYYGALAAGSGIATQATIVGGIAGGAAGGAIATKSADGAFWGAVTGGAFAGVDVGYAGDYTGSRVLVEGSLGGASAAAQGGEFWQGFGLSATSAGAEYAYQSIVKYGTDWGPGEEARSKSRYQMPIKEANNFAAARRVVDPTTWGGEGGIFSRFMNQVPGMNAIAGMHDVFQVNLDLAGGKLLRSAMNYPGMPVAAALTYPALLHGPPAVWIATDD